MFQHYERLSPRELAIVDQVAVGNGDKEIARSLGLSLHTVKGYVKSSLRKTGTANRTELAAGYVRWLSARGEDGDPSNESPRKRE